MYRRYELLPELDRPLFFVGDKSSGMATDPPAVGDIVTFRVGGLAVFDLVVEAIGDGTVQGKVAGTMGYFTAAYPQDFALGERLEVDTAAIHMLRHGCR